MNYGHVCEIFETMLTGFVAAWLFKVVSKYKVLAQFKRERGKAKLLSGFDHSDLPFLH